MLKCPGQDMQRWKPGDIFTVICPHCGYEIEFWKDEPLRPCNNCQQELCNPKLNLGCAKWCKYGPQCLEAINQAKPTG
jgi:hypothetical protein